MVRMTGNHRPVRHLPTISAPSAESAPFARGYSSSPSAKFALPAQSQQKLAKRLSNRGAPCFHPCPPRARWSMIAVSMGMQHHNRQARPPQAHKRRLRA
jgi:hypothetical protein